MGGTQSPSADEKRVLRFRMIEKLYQLTNGSPANDIELAVLTPGTGLSNQEAESIAERALRDLYEKQQALQGEIDNRRGLEERFRQVQKMEM